MMVNIRNDRVIKHGDKAFDVGDINGDDKSHPRIFS
jgi:hypothetical protein